MDIPPCHYRISIKALIFDETREKFLVVQEENGTWELPGGGLDFGETPEECLRREIKEEMDLEVTHIAKQPSYAFTFEKHKNTNYPGWKANIMYEARLKDLNFTPSDECARIEFVTPAEALQLKNAPNIHALAKLLAPDKP